MSVGVEYHSFLLRLWQVSTDRSAWLILLESVRTGEKFGFSSLDELMDYLGRLTDKVEISGMGSQSEVQG